MSNKIIPVAIAIVGIIVIGFLIFGGKGDITGNTVEENNVNVVKIPLSEISDQATWYEQGNIKYFVVKASDGSIKTAFDACDVCGGSKGYRQQGTDMICNNCGRFFAIDGLGATNLNGGGCWPGHLPTTIEGDNLIIKTSDLEKGKKFF